MAWPLPSTPNPVMLSGAGVQRSGTLAESKHPYPTVTDWIQLR